MNIHKNAPLTPKGREAMVRYVTESGHIKAAAALQFNVTAKTVAKWVNVSTQKAWTDCGTAHQDPFIAKPDFIRHVRCGGGVAPQRCTGKQIAVEVGLSPATVSRILRRLGIEPVALEPAGPVRRYEREHPSELIPPEQSPWQKLGCRLGIRACLHRRCFPGSPSARS